MRWWCQTFLELIERGVTVTVACQRIQRTRATVYDYAASEEGREFREEWAAALKRHRAAKRRRALASTT